MSYGRARTPKVTMIDDLLDLDDDSPNYSNNNEMDILPNGQEDKYAKFIRQKHIPKYQEQIYDSRNDYRDLSQMQKVPQQQFQHVPQQQFQQQPYQVPHNIPLHSPYSCLDVAGHIDNCPICAKFYKNDKSIYIVAIVLLVIICIILLKKVIDNK